MSRALAPVVLDPAAAKTQEDHAAATVADALDGISEDFDEAENEAEEARDNWVKGEDCECRPDRYGYRKWGCPNCGDYHCHDEDCYDPDQIECDCAAENNPLPDPAAFVKDLGYAASNNSAVFRAVLQEAGALPLSANTTARLLLLFATTMNGLEHEMSPVLVNAILPDGVTPVLDVAELAPLQWRERTPAQQRR